MRLRTIKLKLTSKIKAFKRTLLKAFCIQMKKLLFILFIISNVSNLKSQVLLPDSLNKTINGLKEGHWIYYENKVCLTCIGSVLSSHLCVTRHNEYKDFCLKCIENREKLDSLSVIDIQREGFFEQNKKEGVWIYYFNNDYPKKGKIIKRGDIEYKIPFVKDSINGNLITYYPNGVIKSEIEFSNNKPEGRVKCYSEDGKLKMTGIIKKDDKIFYTQDYYSNGRIIKHDNFFAKEIMQKWTNLTEIEKLIK